jgi:nucleoside-diphosphate-sugar epimerase
MSEYARALAGMRASPRRWVVTGGAGFIGSHLVETLLQHGQEVAVLEDFSTGSPENLEIVRREVGAENASRLFVTRAYAKAVPAPGAEAARAAQVHPARSLEEPRP